MSTWEAPRDQVAVFVILSGLKEELKTSQVAFCLYNINCGVEKLNFHKKKKKKHWWLTDITQKGVHQAILSYDANRGFNPPLTYKESISSIPMELCSCGWEEEKAAWGIYYNISFLLLSLSLFLLKSLLPENRFVIIENLNAWKLKKVAMSWVTQ